MKDFQQELVSILGEEAVKVEEPMCGHTTFRIGGPAQFFVMPKDMEELARTVGLCRRRELPFYIVGNGSNLLVSDAGWRGLVLSTERLCRRNWEGTVLRAGAGARLSVLAKEAWERSMTGLEFAAGIPGTLGGAVVMNAGAYGCEIKGILAAVLVLDREGSIHRKDAAQLELGYRTSRIPGNGEVVLEAELVLRAGDKEAVRERMEELAFRRREKQPLQYPSAGSTFKRPPGFFAGRLIEDAGLRGFQVGGAQVSEKHCGFVINKDHASARDVMELCGEVRRRVKERFGVELELEIKLLGF